MSASPIVAIHGFLGLPSDWEKLPWSESVRGRLQAYDLFAHIKLAPDAFNAWASEFLSTVQPGSILLGYSLGARLAMHAALMDPSRFSALVLVAGNPGLKSEEEKSQRLANDLAWAKRFQTDSWPELMSAWNSQAVFAGGAQERGAIALARAETDFSRKQLAQAMDVWSLGRQEDQTARLSRLPNPTLVVSGERDTKFTSLALQLASANPRFESRILAQAAHRVPWDAPKDFVSVIEEFFARHTP